MPDAISLPPLWWRKKKGYIIPASFYTTNKPNTYKNETESTVVAEDPPPKQHPPIVEIKSASEKEIKHEIPLNSEVEEESKSNVALDAKISIPEVSYQSQQKSNKKAVSGFSISSIQLKRTAKQQKAAENPQEELPETPFTEADVQAHWKQFTEKKINEGAQNLAAILALKKPVLEDHFVISFQVANSLNEVEMKQALPEILEYLRIKLNNYSLTIKLTVSEHIREETVYSPDEKYNYLVKINPELKYLKDTFDLDL